MKPLGVIEVYIALDSETQLRQTDVFLDFEVLVLQSPPETLHFGVVTASPATIQADPDPPPLQFGNKFFAGKLASLIRIEDLGIPMTPDRHLQCFHAMKRVHRINHVVRHQLAAEPVHYTDHEGPMTIDRCIGDVRAPHLVAVVDVQTAKEVWELPV